MFEKMKLSAGEFDFPIDLDFQFQKSRLPTFPLQLCLTHNESGLFGLDCNMPLKKSDPYELSSDFGCYLPLFDNLYFRPKTILSFCLASPPSNACQKSEIFQIWKCLKYIRLSFCPIQSVPKLVFKPVQGVPHKDRYVKINQEVPSQIQPNLVMSSFRFNTYQSNVHFENVAIWQHPKIRLSKRHICQQKKQGLIKRWSYR